MKDGRQERAEAIRVARARYQLDQADIAKHAGIAQGTVSKAEQGRGSDDVYDAIEKAITELVEVLS